MKNVYYKLKVIISVLLFLVVLMMSYFTFFSPRELRFSFAEHMQGLLISQKMFDIIIAQDSTFSDAYFEKSVAFNKRGEYLKGFRLLDKAVEIKPKNHLGYRGWLKLNFLRDYKGCIEDLSLLNSLMPDSENYAWGESTHFLLGMAYKGSKQYDSALTEFDKYIETEKDSTWVIPSVYLHKGIIRYELEEYHLAMKNFKACLNMSYGHSSEASYYLGLTYKKLDEIENAKKAFENAKNSFKKGYKLSNVYYEVQNELYLSDIIIELQ